MSKGAADRTGSDIKNTTTQWFAHQPLAQSVACKWCQRHITSIPVLGVLQGDDPMGQIDLLPCQIHNFRAAHTCFDGQGNYSGQATGAGMFQDPLKFRTWAFFNTDAI